jgi:hypothetical protein
MMFLAWSSWSIRNSIEAGLAVLLFLDPGQNLSEMLVLDNGGITPNSTVVDHDNAARSLSNKTRSARALFGSASFSDLQLIYDPNCEMAHRQEPLSLVVFSE